MNRERLQQMVTMLRELPATNHIGFDLGDWYCGTTACAVGHACLDPVFREQGLTLRQDFDGVCPVFGVHDGWDAVEMFFELSTAEAENLFYRPTYPEYGANTTPAHVADRIEELLAIEV